MILHNLNLRTTLIFGAILILLISACTSDASVILPTESSATPDNSGPPIGLEPTATVPPPTYREPVASITLDNVANIAYLGRLDTPGRKSTVFNWAFSPDGIQLAALNNELIMEWNLATGILMFSTARDNTIRVFYSPDKSEIYAVDVSGTVRILQSGNGREENNLIGHNDFAGTTAYSPDAGLLAMGGNTGDVKVWDMEKRSSLATFETHETSIADLAFSPDGEILATAGNDGTVKLWNWREKTLLNEFNLEEAFPLKIVFSPDGNLIASSTDNFVAVWDVTEGDLSYVLQTGENGANEVLSFSPDGNYLVVAGLNGNMRLYDTKTSNIAIELPEIGGNRIDAAFSPDNNLLTTTVMNKSVALWNLTEITDTSVGSARLDVQTANIFGVEWSSDGYTVIFFEASGEIFVWGIPKGA